MGKIPSIMLLRGWDHKPLWNGNMFHMHAGTVEFLLKLICSIAEYGAWIF